LACDIVWDKVVLVDLAGSDGADIGNVDEALDKAIESVGVGRG
jgi:hypothetical protein